MSDPKVIELSRRFVCARLLTYESAEEAVLLKSLLQTRSGELENTVFVLLAPDGTTKLCDAGRSPGQSFGRRNALPGMREAMAAAITQYPGNAAAKAGLPAVPYHATVRLGLATAGADIRPLIVVSHAAHALQDVDPVLAKLLWSDEFAGRFSIAKTTKREELATMSGLPAADGVMVVGPDEYGTNGVVLAFTPARSEAEIAKVLREGLATYRPADKEWHTLMREGRRKGVTWKTAIPVTDPGPGGAERRRR